MSNALTPRPILQKPQPEEVEKPKRYAFVVCPNCSGIPSCGWCNGTGQMKLELIRLAPGSKAKGGTKAPKRTTADAKHSNTVREQWKWSCSVCHKDFSANPGGLQCMHYVKRRYRALRKGYAAHTGDSCCLRHDPQNAAAGCISCHLRLENNPAEHETHFRGLWGNKHCDALREEAQKNSGKRVKRNVA